MTSHFARHQACHGDGAFHGVILQSPAQHYFLDRNTGADLITQYVEEGSDARPMHHNWREA